MDNTVKLNFDKLVFVKKLSANGYTQEQSEILANALDEALTESQSHLVTKSDLKETENHLLYAIGGGFIATITVLIAVIGLIKLP
ncbi:MULTISPECIES: hypothetical protein [Gallibacterium]|uniref:DUF1640 domain-containing protein n=1 Tax=Gallibacterium anatis TaxID=750 RepID=A0A1A7NWN0_9PAST|nr:MULTISPECIES: hypothetical protein [Gallibacterium]MDA3978082.1 hypothetical protein [Gallibacterium sp. AGMB14963]OBW94617.1 hypothetical protein QV02_06895 [Gallibacterium anatis]OBW96147.1 hypothetical protein QV03_11175 [Gallibacterium anatis]STO37411.1 Uncharacterised protein [Gallibacterium anatis]